MPITATVIAMRAAIGLMACSAVKEVAKNANKATSETKITVALIAKCLWLNFPYNPAFYS